MCVTVSTKAPIAVSVPRRRRSSRRKRRRALKKLGAPGTPLVTIRQVHSNHCAIADTLGILTRSWGRRPGYLAENLATAVPRPTAPRCCFLKAKPPSLSRPRGLARRQVGLERTVRETSNWAATEARSAVVGPTIGLESYEVSDAFRDGFLLEDTANDRFFGPGNQAGHPMFDLPSYVVAKLNALGLENVADLGVDTLSNSEVYFSYRDSQKTGAGDYGRNLSVIALTEGA